MIEKQINIVVSTKGSEKAEANIAKLTTRVETLSSANAVTKKTFDSSRDAILESTGATDALDKATNGLGSTVLRAALNSSLLSKEGKIMSVVNKGLAYTQGLWNAAMAANPIGLLVAAIAAVIAAGYLLIKFFMDSAAANEAAMAATKKHTKELENQTAKATQSSEALKVKNNQLLALAKASGASAEEIRRLTLQYANEEVAVNRANAVIASNTFIRERNTLAVLKAKGVSEEAIAAQEKLTNASYKDLQNANKILQGSYDKRRDIINSAEVEILQSKTDNTKKANEQAALDLIEQEKIAAEKIKTAFEAEKTFVENQLKLSKGSIDEKRKIVLEDNKLSKEDRNKFLLDLQQQEIDLEEAHNKAIVDLNKRYDDEKANRLADTAVKKEELDYANQVLEIERIAETELEKQTLIEKLNEEHLIRMGVAKKTDADKKEAEDKAAADKEIEIAKRVLEQKKSLQDAQINLASSAVGLLGAIAGKNKALQKASIVAENAIGIGKMFITTAASNVKATAEGAALSFSTGGASLGIAAALVASNNVSLGLNVASSLVATQKALAALGGGGGGAGGGNNSGAKGAPAPSFNLVQGTGSNQIAEGLATERRPVQAYVVASQVSTAQSLDRNIIDRATL
jgi:hypothetical protein